MTKIGLYEKVKLISDYVQTNLDGEETVYKKGLTGMTIDHSNDENYLIVEIESDEYEDTIPAIPMDLLERIE